MLQITKRLLSHTLMTEPKRLFNSRSFSCLGVLCVSLGTPPRLLNEINNLRGWISRAHSPGKTGMVTLREPGLSIRSTSKCGSRKARKDKYRDKPMTPERWKQVNLSFSRYGDRLDFDKELFTYELFHNNQRACGRAFRVDVAVSSFTQ